MLKKIESFFVGLTTIAVLLAGAFLWDIWDDLEPRIHYFWGPYKSELKAGAGLTIALQRNVSNCNENQELRRLAQLNLLRVNGTCTVELTEYSKQWEANCPDISSEKYICVFVKLFTNQFAEQRERKGDFVRAELEAAGKFTPWVTADRTFSQNNPSVAAVNTVEELRNLLEELSHYLSIPIYLTYEYNGRLGRWERISATDLVHNDPFHRIPSF